MTTLKTNYQKATIIRLVYIAVFLCYSNIVFSQQQNYFVTPQGVLDRVYDQRGRQYNLADLSVNNETNAYSQSVLLACSASSIFNLYFEPGCGMENTSIAVHNLRRNVICKVFQDLSDFLSPPGAPLQPTSSTKVNIWVRNIANETAPAGTGALASSFFIAPPVGSSGILDGEIWKTIHLGVDSYTNVPFTPSNFYHGKIAVNFNDPAIQWHTTLTSNAPANLYDLYTAILHEVTHALGIHTFINENGASVTNANYYTRYDTFLKTNAGSSLLSIGTCSMYDVNFAVSPTVLRPTCGSPGNTNNGNPLDVTSCANAIKYVGTSTIPVYTPVCYEPGGSLSHFEDLLYPSCAAPSVNDSYFVLSNRIPPGVTKRYLKPEERNVLCDIGYKTKTTFGVSGALINGASTSFTYTAAPICNGINVAGVNDGVAGGAYTFIGSIGTTGAWSTTVNISNLLANDTANATGFVCLEDTLAPSGTTTIVNTSGTASTTSTFSTTVPGLHLLRYVPINVANQRGNITYVFVYVIPPPNPGSCSPTPIDCDLVMNGNFEQFSPTIGLPTAVGQIIKACGWGSVNPTPSSSVSPSYFNTFAVPTSAKIPCNNYGAQASKNNLGNGYGHIWYSTGIGGKQHLYTTLKTPLQGSTNYQLSFDVSLSDANSSFASNLRACFSRSSTVPPTILPLTPNGDVDTNPLPTSTNTAMLLPPSSTVIRNVNGWDTVTFNFTTSSTGGEQFLYIGLLNNSTLSTNSSLSDTLGCTYTSNPGVGSSKITSYYIDNVSLIPTNGAVFDLPTSVCSNQILSNLTAYLSGVPTTGYFTGNGVLNTGGIYSFDPSIAGAGTTTIGYTYTTSSCTFTINDTLSISPNPIVTPTFSFNTTLCYGTTPPVLPGISSNGIAGTWSPSTVSNVSSVNYVFTPNLGQCANATTVRITTNSYPAVFSMTPATQTVCRNGVAIPLQVVVSGPGLTYQWYSNTTNTASGGSLIAGATTASYVPPTTTTGTKYYYVIITRDSCVTTSAVISVIISLGTANPGTITGVQNLCKIGKDKPTTVFTASVPGGTWSSSNTLVATIVSVTANTATISVGPGTATISYTVSDPATGCTSTVTRTVTTTIAPIPTFTQFPVNPTSGTPDPKVVCVGATPPTLPTTSSNSITGTWSPATISNSASGTYIFTPDGGQCSTSLSVSVIVTNTNNYIANADTFYVTQPTTSLVTGSVLNNDTYNGNYLAGTVLPGYLSYSIVPLGTPPAISAGGISFNTTAGTFTVQPGTPPGTYTYYYVLQTPCGPTGVLTPVNTCTAVNIIVGSYVIGASRAEFSFCFNNNSPTVSTSNLIPFQGQYSLFNGTTIGGVPANSGNAVIQVISPATPSLPAGIVINPDGTFTIPAGTLPSDYTFYYRVCSLTGGYCSSPILWTIVIRSPLKLVHDTATYNIDGDLSGGGIFNVLSNDLRNQCDGTYTGTNTSLTSVTLAGSATTPAYFRIQNNGTIAVDAIAGTGGTIPPGTYTLSYTVCDNTFPAICATQTVTIYVTNTFKMASPLSSSTASHNVAHSGKISTFQIINFPDSNLKARLLEASDAQNIAYLSSNGYTTAVDTNGDNEIDTNEALLIGRLNLISSNITNLIGLEYFTNLTSLSAPYNNISSYNLPLSSLRALALHINPLTNVDISSAINLYYFHVNNTLLTSLDVSNNTLLNAVGIADTQINTIDLGVCHNLGYFYCRNNPNLTSINIKNTSSLDYSNTNMVADCWANCPNLSSICADASEIPALQAFLSGCGVSTGGIDINSNCALSISEFNSESFVVYPNPSSGIFQLTFKEPFRETAVYTVYDVLGKKLLQKELSEGSTRTEINLGNYSQGIYLLNVTVGNSTVSKKMVKE